MRLDHFRALVRSSALFNIIFASPLVLPGISVSYLRALGRMNDALGLGGQPVTVPEDPLHALLINTAGIDLVLIGVILLAISGAPERHRAILWANAAGRLLFALVIAYYVVAHDLNRIAVVFGAIDVAISSGLIAFLRSGEDLPSA